MRRDFPSSFCNHDTACSVSAELAAVFTALDMSGVDATSEKARKRREEEKKRRRKEYQVGNQDQINNRFYPYVTRSRAFALRSINNIDGGVHN